MILGLVAVLTVVVLFVFSLNENNDSTPTPGEKTKIAGEKNDFNDLPTATTTAAGVVNPSPTKSVVIGDLDWTKNKKRDDGSVKEFLQNYKFNSPEEQARIQSDDPCAVAGLDDNWSDPFEKTMCGMTRFIGRQVIEPLGQMACNFSGAALAANYGNHIDSKYIDKQCYILDRK